MCTEKLGPLNNVMQSLRLGSIAQVQPTDVYTRREKHSWHVNRNRHVHTRKQTKHRTELILLQCAGERSCEFMCL